MILSRLAVVVGVLLVVAVLIGVRLFVHVDVKTNEALLGCSTVTNDTDQLSANCTGLYRNVTLAP